MSSDKGDLDEARTSPIYSIGDAARLAGVHPTTVRRWLYGAVTQGHELKPVFGFASSAKEGQAEVSFLQFVEIIVVGRFRKGKRITLQRIRDAHKYAREQLGVDFPFARFSLTTDGKHILQRYEQEHPGPNLLALDSGGQWALPGHVVEAIRTFEFEEDLAARWFPEGKAIPIVVDPRFGAGRPTIPNRRLTVAIVYKRWKAGQTIRFIANDFKLQLSVVEEALRFAEKYAA